MSKILITGGTGYIGSHTAVELLRSGREVVAFDNLSNSSIRCLDAIRRLANQPVSFVEGDLRDRDTLERLFDDHEFESVIHFAGLKAVGESVANPLRYFHNNITGTLNLVDVMGARSVKQLVFSSSATVYGEAATSPITESAPTAPTNPYGRTKLMIEQILTDLCAADPQWAVSNLRYFNPVGAHPSGDLGEDPCGVPNNLLPFITQVAVGRLPELRIFGDDYPTPDGTGIRDYIHVVDLARGHLAALDFIRDRRGAHIHNLGTGRGYSVLEVLRAFERVSGRTIAHRVVARRPGDIAVSFADASKAWQDFEWRAEIGIDTMCEDAWRWQSRHPHGFR